VGAAIALGFNVAPAPDTVATAGAADRGLGYAVPGGVIAVGLLVPFAAFDNASMPSWRRISGSTPAF
jgi:iron(III) transport system permease protein